MEDKKADKSPTSRSIWKKENHEGKQTNNNLHQACGNLTMMRIIRATEQVNEWVCRYPVLYVCVQDMYKALPELSLIMGEEDHNRPTQETGSRQEGPPDPGNQQRSWGTRRENPGSPSLETSAPAQRRAPGRAHTTGCRGQPPPRRTKSSSGAAVDGCVGCCGPWLYVETKEQLRWGCGKCRGAFTTAWGQHVYNAKISYLTKTRPRSSEC